MGASSVKVRSVAKKPNGRGTLKLERRASEREPATGSLSATYTNGTDRYGLTHLQLIDRSERGLGAYTRSAIAVDCRLAVRHPRASASCR